MSRREVWTPPVIEEVTAFVVEGKRHDTLTQARQHIAWLRLCALADEGGVCRGGEWSADMVLNWMTENAETLAEALTEYARLLRLVKEEREP
jgi:predicted Fe-S protein YdhL (DUF1289 family)